MKFKHRRKLLQYQPYSRFRNRLKRISFKGGNITLYEVLVVFFKKIKDDEIIERSNAVAYSFTIALFPAIIFLFALVPVIHSIIPEVDLDNIMDFMSQWMPQNMFSVIESTIRDIIGKSRGGLLTVGALLALYLASNGMVSLMNAFNSIYKTKENRSFLRQRMIAFGLIFMLGGVMVLSIVLLVVGQVILGLISDLVIDIDSLPININQVLILRFFVLSIVFLIAIASIYYFAPAVHFRWHFFSVGSIVATTFILLMSYVFSYYVANFGTYNKLYGSIGVMLALMIWLFLFSIVLLVGYVINASIHQVQHMHKIIELKKEDKIAKPKLTKTSKSIFFGKQQEKPV
jgi:membrane protein